MNLFGKMLLFSPREIHVVAQFQLKRSKPKPVMAGPRAWGANDIGVRQSLFTGDLQPLRMELDELSGEAKTILVVAVDRGSMDIRASREPFDSSDRFLAVCVEFELVVGCCFYKDDPQQTVRFLDGFRQLCQSGLVLHHLQKDFSLSAAGFGVAKQLNRTDHQSLIDFVVEIEH